MWLIIFQQTLLINKFFGIWFFFISIPISSNFPSTHGPSVRGIYKMYGPARLKISDGTVNVSCCEMLNHTADRSRDLAVCQFKFFSPRWRIFGPEMTKHEKWNKSEDCPSLLDNLLNSLVLVLVKFYNFYGMYFTSFVTFFGICGMLKP